MTTGAMSDGSPVSPELDARLLADLREFRAHWNTGIAHVTLTIDELDMLLRVAAERDALRRELVDMPDDHAVRHGHPGEPCRDRSACYPGDRSTAPVPVRSVPFTAEIPDEVRERSGEPAMRTPGVCSRCGGRLYYSVPSHAWVHSGAVPKGCVPRPTPRPDRAS